ncbi:hypothetical protein [Actinoplanes sp. N902-109]|uniref:hypothetical protein n=1 Tax=Actinoplanes sp. (strain N902-109) TaxID=649831 RepID=UPI0003294BD8|nr:hypothetical protein [Actinoplanes sp. N902-109]AGL17039.1 hypothetical protein L083_3529 [Actinoplanes sp. N902-109]
MSDVNPEQYSEYTTSDGPGSADADPQSAYPEPEDRARDYTDPQTGDEYHPEPDRAQGARG